MCHHWPFSLSFSVPAGAFGGVYVSVWSIVPIANWMTGSAVKPHMLTHWSLVYSDCCCRHQQDSILSMLLPLISSSWTLYFLIFGHLLWVTLPPPPPFSLFSPSLHYSLSPPLFFPRWRLDRIWISLWAKMSWLSRLNPRGPGTRTGRHAAPSSPCTADPETCLMVFENHWRQVRHRIGLFALMLFVQIISLVQLQTFKLNLEHWL